MSVMDQQALDINTQVYPVDEIWMQANQRHLLAALKLVKYDMASYLAHERHTEDAAVTRERHTEDAAVTRERLQQEVIEAEQSMAAPSRLSSVCAVFNLSSFERAILLLCAGIELDSEFALLCFAIYRQMMQIVTTGDSEHIYDEVLPSAPTFGLAREVFYEVHWDAFLPVAPLRHWHLLVFGNENMLMSKSLRIDEYILHYLTGAVYIDERLSHMLEAPTMSTLDDVVPSQRILVHDLTALWSQALPGLLRVHEDRPPHYPLVQLCGEEAASIYAIATAACREVGFYPESLPLAHILSWPVNELVQIMRLWERMAALHGTVLLLDCFQVEKVEIEHSMAFSWLAQRLHGPLIVISRERLMFPAVSRMSVTYPVVRAETDELRLVWQSHLFISDQSDEEFLDRVVAQFRLNSTAVQAIVAEVFATTRATLSRDELQDRIWDACRVQSRTGLAALVQRIESHAGWQDLVLPDAQLQLLQAIAAQARNRMQVYERWGFRSVGSGRGFGISVMFAGTSGTGKTLAAEVLAQALRLDLYRIDLSSIVSKYIGETEKNLQRVFDAAEAGGAVLLFDEADALFGKRSDVKDSHDRYANIEVSYLLQCMEAYQGLAILTTNLKNSIDGAFLRRLRFVVQFPFPDVMQRAEIWRRAFPPALPVAGVDVEKLARLSVAGGNIRNIALNAAFFAAEEQQSLQMRHVLKAARIEYAKQDRPLTDSEIEGWV